MDPYPARQRPRPQGSVSPRRPSPGRGRSRKPRSSLVVARDALVAMAGMALGGAATAAGAGLALRHFLKAGLSLPVVLGASLLVGGVLLLASAFHATWRILPRWWRLLLVPTTVVILQLALSAALAVMYAVVPPTALGSRTPADELLPYRSVRVATEDGVQLAAWYVPSRNGAAVVVLHGAGATRTSALPQAGVLGRAGYGVLLMDARGHGTSGGRGMDLGWYGDQDVAAAVRYLVRRAAVDPARIGLLGLSMGGEEAIGAAAARPRVAAVVAEGATGRTAQDAARLDHSGLARAVDGITFGLTDLLTPASPPISLHQAVATSSARFLLIAAGLEPREQAAAADLRAAAPDRVRTWNVPGAGHTAGLATAPLAWRHQVLGFFADTLRQEGSEG